MLRIIEDIDLLGVAGDGRGAGDDGRQSPGGAATAPRRPDELPAFCAVNKEDCDNLHDVSAVAHVGFVDRASSTRVIKQTVILMGDVLVTSFDVV